MGVLGRAAIPADVPAGEVAHAAGAEFEQLVVERDRGRAMEAMTKGASVVVRQLFEQGRIYVLISVGGSAGTTIGTAAMRALPVGFPKLMVSTLAPGDMRPYVGTKDIAMLYSIVDIAGLNVVSRRVLSNAAAAISGMVNQERPAAADEKPLVAATMFGVTTPCVTHARELLEAAGYEVLVFHATGTGGQAMEELITAGFVAGVLDITTTERVRGAAWSSAIAASGSR